jgi:hypothetical protein
VAGRSVGDPKEPLPRYARSLDVTTETWSDRELHPDQAKLECAQLRRHHAPVGCGHRPPVGQPMTGHHNAVGNPEDPAAKRLAGDVDFCPPHQPFFQHPRYDGDGAVSVGAAVTNGVDCSVARSRWTWSCLSCRWPKVSCCSCSTSPSHACSRAVAIRSLRSVSI